MILSFLGESLIDHDVFFFYSPKLNMLILCFGCLNLLSNTNFYFSPNIHFYHYSV